MNRVNKISIGFLICGGLSVGVVTIWWCKLKVRDDVKTINKIFFSNDFHFSFMLGLMDFVDIAIPCNRLNNCCRQNLKCFDEPLFSLRAAMTVKLNKICSSNLSLAQAHNVQYVLSCF